MTSPFDPHFPRYHFRPSANWMNDPNGLIQWRGRYHLFYQYNSTGALWGNIHWGHAVSDDLVRWEHLPPALTPRPEDGDEYGCFSGCAVVHNGRPALVYTATRPQPHGRMPYTQRAHIAHPLDDDLIAWRKDPANPIITPPPGLDLVGFRDHHVWHEGDEWRQIIGSGVHGRGGAVLLFRSRDFRRWEYLHPLCAHDGLRLDGVWLGSMWECPQMLTFGRERVLLFSANHEDKIHHAVYLTGRYESAAGRFVPQAAHRLDFGGRYFYAPQAMVDESGRTLMWGWLPEGRADQSAVAAGWSGVMSLPRVVTLGADGRVRQTPAPELQQLRGPAQRFGPHTGGRLPGVSGRAYELEAVLVPGRQRIEIRVLCAPDQSEYTAVFYDPRTGTVGLDRTRSTTADADGHDLTTPAGPCPPAADGRVHLRIFVDHSVVEVYVNDGAATVTGRVYPAGEDSRGTAVVPSDGRVDRLTAWPLQSIW